MAVSDAIVADITGRLRRDLLATLGNEHAAVVHEETAQLQAFAADAEAYADLAVTNVQEGVQEGAIDSTWPRCPRHLRHPLWFRDGTWWCEADGVAIAPLGELAGAR
jgi:hypothetical protein